ncbi:MULTISPECIES: ABC transporter permease subunit [unclassified Brevundimonas]|uniref:ABC transporter permease subunit n=1 Tax=unclassified Brevundimonas TaxID=2622653 RepID=UPI001FD779E1|nr:MULTISPECIES: ABC transporter permease subunit [unclassified Brevundimonas]
MLSDAIRSEGYRLWRNRSAMFWSVLFAPLAGLALTVFGYFMIQQRTSELKDVQLPPELTGTGGVLDMGAALVSQAASLANPAVLAFVLIGSAVIFAGDYRWETARLTLARNSRANTIIGKVGVVKMLVLAALLAYLASAMCAEAIRGLMYQRSFAFSLSGSQAGDFALLFVSGMVRVMQFLMLALLAAVFTRSLLAALFLPLIVGVAQFFLSQLASVFGLELTSWLAHLLMPGLAFDSLKAAIQTNQTTMLAKAIVSLAGWTFIPFFAALVWFQRQDLSKE